MSADVASAVRFKRAVPQFTVPDVARTAQYYRDVLGFQIASFWDGEQAGGYHAYFHIDGVDSLADELRSRGVTIIDGPEDRIYGQRELVVRDCNGFVLAFGQDTRERATT